ncbi:hypothetical protein A4X06_0g2105 [Tilletia controversa]|uniref:Uncharacterized protein n=1 Tax=Tilletia controversa TaxID=13291 RepID=A0A8X7MX11_9BASI|nr:hypothetical protein CF328_g8085 [Tilletia controversa]KAE8252548.1 hypothetical protein A4X06_0g2105 [Tilletia controversa]
MSALASASASLSTTQEYSAAAPPHLPSFSSSGSSAPSPSSFPSAPSAPAPDPSSLLCASSDAPPPPPPSPPTPPSSQPTLASLSSASLSSVASVSGSALARDPVVPAVGPLATIPVPTSSATRSSLLVLAKDVSTVTQLVSVWDGTSEGSRGVQQRLHKKDRTLDSKCSAARKQICRWRRVLAAVEESGKEYGREDAIRRMDELLKMDKFGLRTLSNDYLAQDATRAKWISRLSFLTSPG